MTQMHRFAVAVLLSLSPVAVVAQQQFGPSPQAMYKQHPGSAPSYAANDAPKLSPVTTPAPSTVIVPRKTVAHKTATKTVRHTTTARRTTSRGTTGR